MTYKRRKHFIIAMFILGIALIGFTLGKSEDTFWNGLGVGLTIVSGLKLLSFYRQEKDESYREQVEVMETDERIRFINGKAWAWAGYLFFLSSAVLSIVFKLLGQDMMSMASTISMGLMAVLYLASYMVIKRKY